MSFMTGQCDFLDNFTLTGNRLYKHEFMYNGKVIKLSCLDDCLPYLLRFPKSYGQLWDFDERTVMDVEDYWKAYARKIMQETNPNQANLYDDLSADSVIGNFDKMHFHVNDKIRVAYYCFMLDAGLDADTAYKYAFGERDRELLAPFIEAYQDYERKFMYRCMKVHFGCSEYRSFQCIFDEMNREG